MTAPHPSNFDLYLITDRSQRGGRELLWIVEQALEGGVDAVQLREKDLGGRELFHSAEKIKSLCERYSARLFINDRVDVALATDADGVQLGHASVPIETARTLLGADKLIGASVHSLAEAQTAAGAGADFVLFGPIYSTPSKARYGEPQGLSRLKEIVEKIPLPVYAIGGINAANIPATKKAGVRGVALISAVMGAADPKLAAQRIVAALGR